MMEEFDESGTVLCPVCGEKGVTLIVKGRDFFVSGGDSDPFEVLLCRKCDMAYSSPYLTESELSQFYPDDFEAYIPKKSFSAYLQKVKYKNDLNDLTKNLYAEGALLLEIGAGRGDFLEEAKKTGFHVEGVEPSEAGRKYAKENYGIILLKESAADVVFNKKYDVIVMKHVLEHVNNPLEVLQNIADCGLTANGLLYLKLPRLDSWEFKFFQKYWHGLDLPRHRVHFTKKGLVKMLIKTGFKEVTIRSEVVPSDISRSLQYCASHESSNILKGMAYLFSFFPSPLKLISCQIVGIILSMLRPGRMIAFARKTDKL